jgi:sucrose-6F-phosphate phosphohydrolase
MMMGHKLLVSDVDGTLLGNDADLTRFTAWYERYQPQVQLVYASGNFWDVVAELVDDGILPRPRAIIGGVGTELRVYPEGRPIFNWDERLYECWDEKEVRETLAEWDRLEPQPDEFQSEFKVSYYLRNASRTELDGIRSLLRDASINADLVYSSRRDLDVLPAGIDKGTAAAFLAEYYEYEPEEVIVCGDSANDLAMFQHGFRGIVVGNAHPELQVLEGPTVYKSGESYAAGVLDGLNHWLRQDAKRKDHVIRERATVGS